MYYNVFSSFVVNMQKKSAVITMRLSRLDLERIESVRELEKADRSTLLKEFIEDGLRRRIIHIYRNGRLTATRAAEMLRIPLRVFLEMLENENVPVNWNSGVVRDYLKARYGE